MKKMPTIFLRDYGNHAQLTRIPNPECAWVFNGEGSMVQKLDGSSCMIREGRLFKRRTVKPGKYMPGGFISCSIDPITKKEFGWVEVDPCHPGDKWHVQACNRLTNHSDGTYELVGPMVNGNNEGLSEHRLIAHMDAVVFVGPETRTFDSLREWLMWYDIEGVVFRHPDGRMAKLKKCDFGLSREVHWNV